MIVRKKIKINELFNKLKYTQEEQTWHPPKSLKVLSESGFEKVEGLYKTNKRDVIKITTENHSIKGVFEHKVMTVSGWKNLIDLHLRDRISTQSGWEKIKEIEKLAEKENAYDLQVENTHSFYTNGVLSHNTEMFISLCNLMDKQTLILFSSIDLAHQTMRRMKKAGVDAGIVQGKNVDEKHKVVMATIQSSHKLKRSDYEMVVVDECHKINGNQYQEALRRYDCRYRFGFSATPFIKSKKSSAKLRNARVKAWIGDLIYEVESKDLISENKLAKPYIYLIPIDKVYDKPRDKELNIFEWDWQYAENKGIVENHYRNERIAEIANSVSGQTLILIKRIDHGEALKELIPDSVFLSGENTSNERDEVVEKFEKGEDFTLIASTIFDEGVDIKNVNNVIIAAGGASYIKILQRIGRGMRKMVNKHRVDIYDFYDKTNKILVRHSKERVDIARKEGFTNITLLKD